MDDLRGKVAVVTGAASGIGLALAERWAAEGMAVVLADIDADGVIAAAAQVERHGCDALAVRVDVSSADDVLALAAKTMDRFGAVHLVCNNAGVGGGGRLWEASIEHWRWVLGVNLWGVVHGVRAFVPHLIQQGEGHIVNTASMAGHLSLPGMGPYSASKHAVVALSETLHHELAETGVGVSVLCPAFVRTNIAESHRIAPPGAAPTSTEQEQEVMRMLVDSGIETEAVATAVAEAVRDDRFWVMTHPEMNTMITSRAAEIVASGPGA